MSAESVPLPQESIDIHLQSLNEYRRLNNKVELIYDKGLSECIEQYLVYQMSANFRWHIDPNGRTPTDRCWHLSTKGIWENLIWRRWSTVISPTESLKLWKWSPSHNVNLLYSSYRYVGIAAIYDKSKNESRRWQVFTDWPLVWQSPTFNNITTQQPWNAWQTNKKGNLPKLQSRKVEDPSFVHNWTKVFLRLPVILEREIDLTKASDMSRSILTRLNNMFDQLK